MTTALVTTTSRPTGRLAAADWSTINLAVLRRLPVYRLPPTYRLQTDSGNCCAGDPPGYPTYFTRNVYTQHGNQPRHGYSLVLKFDGVCYGIARADWRGGAGEAQQTDQDRLFRRLWQPLPLDHPRTVAWMQAAFIQSAHCYLDPALPTREHWEQLVIWPLPDWRLEKFTDDPRFSDDWRAQQRAAVETANRELVAHAERIAVPDNHVAVVKVRQFYPQFEPTADLLAAAFPPPGNWWETLAENPGPDRCPGQYGRPHPVNGNWCQFCGWGGQVLTSSHG